MAESKPTTTTMDAKKIDVDSQAVKVICLGDSAVGKSKLVRSGKVLISPTQDVCNKWSEVSYHLCARE